MGWACHGQKHKGKVGQTVWRKKIRNLVLGVLIWKLLQNISIEMSKGSLQTRPGAQRQVPRQTHSKFK